MLDIDQLTNTVQKNCHISDAYHAGSYSMCTFLLKMREYYRWEHHIPLTQALPKNELGEWLVNREESWQQITSDNNQENYLPLNIKGKEFDPFDSSEINCMIEADGFIYSSGFGLFNKPHFFFGQLKNKENYADYTLLISADELARDLTAPPAMLQGSTIFIRQESIRRFVWERIEEWQWKKRQDVPMARAVAAHGSNINMETILDLMVEQETRTMLLHEIGEIEAGKLLGKQWEAMLITLATTKAELLVRAVRDLLADCLCTLPGLLKQDKHASIHFYFANFMGMRKMLFPQAYAAYQTWVKTGDTTSLLDTCQSGQQQWHEKSTEMLVMYQQERDRLEKGIESLFSELPL